MHPRRLPPTHWKHRKSGRQINFNQLSLPQEIQLHRTCQRSQIIHCILDHQWRQWVQLKRIRHFFPHSHSQFLLVPSLQNKPLSQLLHQHHFIQRLTTVKLHQQFHWQSCIHQTRLHLIWPHPPHHYILMQHITKQLMHIQ